MQQQRRGFPAQSKACGEFLRCQTLNLREKDSLAVVFGQAVHLSDQQRQFFLLGQYATGCHAHGRFRAERIAVRSEWNKCAGALLTPSRAGKIGDNVVGYAGKPANKAAGLTVFELIYIAISFEQHILKHIFDVGKSSKVITHFVANENRQSPLMPLKQI